MKYRPLTKLPEVKWRRVPDLVRCCKCGNVIMETGPVPVPVMCFPCAGIDDDKMPDYVHRFIVRFGGYEL